MLAHVGSMELSEWQAYERFAGPVGPQWRDEVLAQSNELLRVLTWLKGQEFADPKRGKSNPVPDMLLELRCHRPDENGGE